MKIKVENNITPLSWLRSRQMLTKRRMAELLEMPESSYGQMEKGEIKISLERSIQLKGLFNIDPELFITSKPIEEWPAFLNKNYKEGGGDIKLSSTDISSNQTTIIQEQEEGMIKRKSGQEILLLIENEQLKDEVECKQKTIEKLKKELLELAENAQNLREELKKCLCPEKANSN
jgi:DNA-binding XRE family transcriptional regulator